jgi:hypothetical protein
MPDSDNGSFRVSRRMLLKAGLAGACALVLARWTYQSTATPEIADARFSALDGNARAIIAAIAPILLEGAMPRGHDAVEARADVVAGVDKAVSGLPPALRKELDQLFALLSFAPTRCLVAGVWSPWPRASEQAIATFLDSWRDSRVALLRSAYGALHQLVLAAWYGNPRSWPAIGYAGPPVLVAP